MLKEIYCEKFISNKSVREPIRFHNGLNTVLGSTSGSNSIGKSTLLMIVDFAFGGNDYADKSTDVLENVQEHFICFCFEFANNTYYFSRSPFNRNEVNKCDNKYNVEETISLTTYRNFLAEKYGIDTAIQNFRGAISTYFRIYLRDCCDEGKPLKNANNAPDRDGITELVKLFNKYEAIKELERTLSETKDKESTLRKAIKYSQISSPSNITEYKNNAKEIEKLKEELRELEEKSSGGLLDVDSIIAKQISDIKGMLSSLRRKRTRIKSQISLLEEGKNQKKRIENDFSGLLKFFPDVDVKSLEEVENFHSTLTDALLYEYKSKIKELKELLTLVEQEIESYEEMLKEINSVPDVSKAILESFASAKQKYNNYIEANKHFDDQKALKQNISDLGKQLNQIFNDEISSISVSINHQMMNDNNYIYSDNRVAPCIVIKDESHYSFDTPNDKGTGSRYKGLILFDLAILKLTVLPAIAHDSFMLKQIEDDVLEKIFELYAKAQKQIFIAIDKDTSYTPRTQEIIRESAVISLSPDGNELFGKSWNKVQ